MDKKYITIKEYSQLTGLHRNTIYRWIKAGRLDVLQGGKGGKYLISTLDIPSYKLKEEAKWALTKAIMFPR